MDKLRIAIVPAGKWGSALAIPFLDNNHQVKLYKGSNFTTPDLEEVKGVDILVISCNSEHVRSLFQKIRPNLSKKTIVVCVSKGIEEGTNLCMSQVLKDIEPNINSKLAVLSGPNFADEISQRLPAMTIVASENNNVAKFLQKAFTQARFFRPELFLMPNICF